MISGCNTAPPALDRITDGQSLAPGQVATVTNVWQPGQRELGIAMYWQNNPQDDESAVRAKASTALNYIVKSGANSVSINYSFVMDSATASAVLMEHEITPSPGRLAIVLDEAKKRKLRITIRPMLNERNLTKDDPDMWRGAITPEDRAAWFTSYREFLVKYAALAESEGVATYVLGTELNSLESDEQGWAKVVSGVKAAYKGELGYSANHDRVAGDSPAPELIKSADAYPSLQLPDDASKADVTAGLSGWLDTMGEGPLDDVVLAEVGIAAKGGAYERPWQPRVGGEIKTEIQQTWFDAICDLMWDRNLAGVYFWMINMDIDPKELVPTKESPMDFAGGPAAQNMSNCFARGADRK